jgi:mannonate dehydratase
VSGKDGWRVIISKVDTIVTSPGRNYVTVRIETDDGIVGLGDATLNGREMSVVSYLQDHISPTLLGRDPLATEDTWQYLYRGAYWRRGPVTMAAISAIDVALWDIKAKAAGMPLYQLLGGASRTGALAYGHATGRDVEQLIDSIHHRLAEGFRAVRIQTGVPGMASTYGVADSAGPAVAYEPAKGGGRPQEEWWDTSAYLRHLPAVFEAVRSTFGPALPLLHDVHHRLTPIEGARLGKVLEQYDPFWMEDPTPAENPAAFRRIREHTTVPLATGEVFNTVWDYQTLINEQLIDYVRSAVTHAGGITPMKKLLDFAAQYQIKSGMHGPSDISPVGFAATLHLDMAISNFGIQEFMSRPAATEEVFRVNYEFVDGALKVGDAPGIGVELDLAAARGFPYKPAYLPVNRLLDGTMHDW